MEKLIRNTPRDLVYLIQHETTTGILNPLREVAKIAKDQHKWVLTDAVSSVGGEELDLPDWGVDLVIGSANKCLRGVPGAAFVVASNEFMEVIASRRPVRGQRDRSAI